MYRLGREFHINFFRLLATETRSHCHDRLARAGSRTWTGDKRQVLLPWPAALPRAPRWSTSTTLSPTRKRLDCRATRRRVLSASARTGHVALGKVGRRDAIAELTQLDTPTRRRVLTGCRAEARRHCGGGRHPHRWRVKTKQSADMPPVTDAIGRKTRRHRPWATFRHAKAPRKQAVSSIEFSAR